MHILSSRNRGMRSAGGWSSLLARTAMNTSTWILCSFPTTPDGNSPGTDWCSVSWSCIQDIFTRLLISWLQIKPTGRSAALLLLLPFLHPKNPKNLQPKSGRSVLVFVYSWWCSFASCRSYPGLWSLRKGGGGNSVRTEPLAARHEGGRQDAETWV